MSGVESSLLTSNNGCLTTSTISPFYHPLQSLELESSCESFRSFNMDLCPNLKTLYISHCDYFESLSMSQCHQELTAIYVQRCLYFVSFPLGGLSAPKLTSLLLSECPKMKWLPEKMSSLSSLESLTIKDCLLIETILEGGMPISLSKLCMSYDELLWVKWNWQTLSHVKHVTIEECEEDMESFPKEGLLPPTITHLEIISFSKLRGLDKNGLAQLTSLQTLEIHFCPDLQTLSEEAFPSSLTSLRIIGCPLLEKINHIPNVECHHSNGCVIV
ncbi:hypothetical protein CsatB_027855 [Cannabis sativa]